MKTEESEYTDEEIIELLDEKIEHFAIECQKKYESIRELTSVKHLTKGKYPSRVEFWRALRENRVCGDYTKHITIVSGEPSKEYEFVFC